MSIFLHYDCCRMSFHTAPGLAFVTCVTWLNTVWIHEWNTSLIQRHWHWQLGTNVLNNANDDWLTVFSNDLLIFRQIINYKHYKHMLYIYIISNHYHWLKYFQLKTWLCMLLHGNKSPFIILFPIIVQKSCCFFVAWLPRESVTWSCHAFLVVCRTVNWLKKKRPSRLSSEIRTKSVTEIWWQLW